MTDIISNSDTALSVVIPVFNAEKYLGSCLEALLKTRGIENAEIILVDDGSTDSSAEIAEGYVKSHKNITIIRKSNEGPSEARNAGLKKASGKYVFFCDADDEVDPGSFSKVVKGIGSSSEDVILWDARIFDDEGTVFPEKRENYFIHVGLNADDGIISGQQAIKKQLDACMSFPATVWLGLHRREFLLDNDLYFANGILHEDELWVIQVLLSARSVRYIPEKIYRYRIHKGSITNPIKTDWTRNIESLLYVYPVLYGLCDEKIEDTALGKKLKAALTRRYLHMIFEYDFCKYGYAAQIDTGLLWKTSGRLIDKCRVILLSVKVFFYKVFKRG